MVKERVPETSEGIQDAITVEQYDEFLRGMRDRGVMETKDIIKKGMDTGHMLEVGPGPGYLGLEWLKATPETKLTGIEISPNMIRIAEKNAAEYGLAGRVAYVEGDAMHMPFSDGAFDGVFTNGSLHEWEHPERVFSEIYRVLKPGGRFYVSDLKRNANPVVAGIMRLLAKPRSMRAGLASSIAAAYTREELESVVRRAGIEGSVSENPFGLCVTGVRQG